MLVCLFFCFSCGVSSPPPAPRSTLFPWILCIPLSRGYGPQRGWVWLTYGLLVGLVDDMNRTDDIHTEMERRVRMEG